MNVVYLVRHGEAQSPMADPQRGLTERGSATVQRLGAWASAVFPTVSEIRHSGKLRAEQTARILANSFQMNTEPIAVSGLNPNDDVVPVAESLAGVEHPLMLVGHLPFLARLTSCLVVGDPGKAIVDFDTAALVRLYRDQYGWTIDTVMQPGGLG